LTTSHTAQTVVASVQTLSRRTRLTRLVPDFQTIVIDEAHHTPAPTYRPILEYCRAWHPDGPLVVGVTATPNGGITTRCGPSLTALSIRKRCWR
jgi:superfamily II DNA or RNA helicase